MTVRESDMSSLKYKTQRVAARNLRVGTVCYHGGEIVSIQPRLGTGILVGFLDGHQTFYEYPERVRIYPYFY